MNPKFIEECFVDSAMARESKAPMSEKIQRKPLETFKPLENSWLLRALSALNSF